MGYAPVNPPTPLSRRLADGSLAGELIRRAALASHFHTLARSPDAQPRPNLAQPLPNPPHTHPEARA